MQCIAELDLYWVYQETLPVLSSGAMLIKVLPTPRARGVPSVRV